jgi:hypothetical protein
MLVCLLLRVLRVIAKTPSRKRQTRREAGTQSHGSGSLPDSRVAEGEEKGTLANMVVLGDRH